MKFKQLIVLLALVLTSHTTFVTSAHAQTPVPWPMAGANPARTGWVPTGITGDHATMDTVWAKPISPLISSKVQPIAAEGKIFVSSAKGIYAFDATNGNQLWVYATELPIGHSPAYANGVVYAAGFDRKIHAINATTGQAVWTFTAGGPFNVSPAIVNGIIYAGSRDGAMYAVNTAGQQVWKYQTGNQIDQTAAVKDGVVYVGSNDARAYAFNAANGTPLWFHTENGQQVPGSDKLPGMGWRSWWPVVYRDWVVFTRTAYEKGLATNLSEWLFSITALPDQVPGEVVQYPANNPNCPPLVTPAVTFDWTPCEFVVDLRTNTNNGKTFADYYERYPRRREAFFLKRTNGQEEQFDIDNDGVIDAAPVSFAGDAGNRYPPIVVDNPQTTSVDDVIYFRSMTHSSQSDTFGGIAIMGWKVGTPFISLPASTASGQSGYWAGDEPAAIAAAGSKIYWSFMNDRFSGAVDLTIPNTTFPEDSPSRQWRYVTGGGNPPAGSMPVGYSKEINKFFWKQHENPPAPAGFWGEHDTPAPIIYNNRVYAIMANALVAFTPGGAGTSAPVHTTAPDPTGGVAPDAISSSTLTTKLEQEVEKIVTSGHLKPSLVHFGLLTTRTDATLDDFTSQLWHNPGDLHLVLTRALPYVTNTPQNQNLKDRLKTYLQTEFAAYPPYQYSHIGWQDGNQRDDYLYPLVDPNPPDGKQLVNIFNLNTLELFDAQNNATFGGWGWPPHNAYAIWKYAAAGLGNASTLFTNNVRSKLQTPITTHRSALTDAYLAARPHVHNAYIAGYKGYIELANLAGATTGAGGVPISEYQAELTRLMQLRAQNFTTFPPYPTTDQNNYNYFYNLVTGWNFMYLTTELADYLQTHATTKVQEALSAYQAIAPYWMFALNGETQGENAIMPYQQTHAIFQAKAMVTNASRTELTKYLDSPIVPVGDLYYIDNLVATLEAGIGGGGGPSPSPSPAPSFFQVLSSWLLNTLDQNGDGKVNSLDFAHLLP